jgi:alcohol dehydrogenase YqhD (iron-dependent ADH family)
MSDITATANAGLAAFRAWLVSIRMPLTLSELGIPKQDVPVITKQTVNANKGKIAGFMDLDEKAINAIYSSIA